MRCPVRKSEQFKKFPSEEGPVYLTPSAFGRLKKTLEELQKFDLPQAIEDVRVTAENGDFSENAEYQEAKHRLRRIQGRIMSLQERIKQAVLIDQEQNSSSVRLGSTIIVETEEKEKTYQIVGPQEADPLLGKISHVSPLGSLLLGCQAGEEVILKTEKGERVYKIKKVN